MADKYQLVDTVGGENPVVMTTCWAPQQAFSAYHSQWYLFDREGRRLVLQLSPMGRILRPISKTGDLARMIPYFLSRYESWRAGQSIPKYECHIVTDFGRQGEKHYLRSTVNSNRLAQIDFTQLWNNYHVQYGYNVWMEAANHNLFKGYYPRKTDEPIRHTAEPEELQREGGELPEAVHPR